MSREPLPFCVPNAPRSPFWNPDRDQPLCKVYFAALQFFCDEPPKRHCAIPADPDHLAVCEMAHHPFRATYKLSLPPREAITKELGR